MQEAVSAIQVAPPVSDLPPIRPARLPLASRIPWRARQILAGGLKRLPLPLIAGAPPSRTAVVPS
jgi:hypothetical protein